VKIKEAEFITFRWTYMVRQRDTGICKIFNVDNTIEVTTHKKILKDHVYN